jgi:hypothetical protein
VFAVCALGSHAASSLATTVDAYFARSHVDVMAASSTIHPRRMLDYLISAEAGHVCNRLVGPKNLERGLLR